VNLMTAKFAFWLNDNSTTQDASQNPVLKNLRVRKIEFGLKGARIISGTGPGSTSQRPWSYGWVNFLCSRNNKWTSTESVCLIQLWRKKSPLMTRHIFTTNCLLLASSFCGICEYVDRTTYSEHAKRRGLTAEKRVRDWWEKFVFGELNV